MSNPEGDLLRWNNFYEKASISSFEKRKFYYKQAINCLSLQNPELLTISEPKKFVLGGVCATNNSYPSFKQLCQDIHPNPDDVHIVIDMNYSPLSNLIHNTELSRIESVTESMFIQTTLEKLPFSDQSIDFIFLDGTLEYMNNEQVESFAQSADKILAKNGVVLIVKRFQQDAINVARRFADNETDSLYPITYPRSCKEVRRITQNLKLVYLDILLYFQLIALTKNSSNFPKYKPTKDEWIEYPKTKLYVK
jgi:hypothetical protein